MTAAQEARRTLRVVWGAVRGRVPRADLAARTAREAVRMPGSRARRTAELALRVHRLEQDQALIAAQVAALGALAPAAPVADDVAGRLAAARLEAIALYEHRIGELERRVLKRRDTPVRSAAGRTADELAGRS